MRGRPFTVRSPPKKSNPKPEEKPHANPFAPLRPALLSILALFTLSLPACSKGIDGKYISSGGLWTLEFKSGKATLSGMGESETTDYTVDGDKITIKSKKGVGGLVLMRMKDGSLEGGFGTFKKSAG